MTCAPQDLFALASCFQCLSAGQLDLVKLALYCRWAQGITTPCDIQTLLNEAGCFECLTRGEQQLLRVALLCQISQNAPAPPPVVISNTPTGDLIANETFETPATGYVLPGWTWNGVGSWTPTYAVAPLDGVQSLGVVAAAQAPLMTKTYTPTGEVWGWFMFLVANFTVPGDILSILDAGNVQQCLIQFDGTSFSVSTPTNFAGVHVNIPGGLALGQRYFVWFHHKPGSGANSIEEIAVSTTPTRPAWTTANNGAAVNNTSKILVGNTSVMSGGIEYDRINLASVSTGF